MRGAEELDDSCARSPLSGDKGMEVTKDVWRSLVRSEGWLAGFRRNVRHCSYPEAQLRLLNRQCWERVLGVCETEEGATGDACAYEGRNDALLMASPSTLAMRAVDKRNCGFVRVPGNANAVGCAAPGSCSTSGIIHSFASWQLHVKRLDKTGHCVKGGSRVADSVQLKGARSV